MATSFEYDPEKLIEEVKKRPAIWDFYHQHYRAKQVRHKLWNDIVKELIVGNHEVTRSDVRELELQIQKKWKSIRDCYQKYLTNKGSWKQRPYCYAKQLEFIRDIVCKNASMREGACSESDEEKATRKRAKKTIKVGKEESEDEEVLSNDNVMSDSEPVVEVPQIADNTNGKPYVEDFMFANVDTQSRGDYDDPDKMFLLSLLPHLKAVPREQQLNVKMDLMHVLRNAGYSAEQKIFS